MGNNKINPIAVYEPLPWQIEPLLCTDFIMLLTGSAGGGKSKVSGEKIHLYLKKYPKSMGLLVRKTKNSMVNSTVLFMESSVIGQDPGVRHFPSKSRFEYDNGSILAYGGMDGEEQKQQIRSIGQEGSLHIVWMEEANAFTEDDFNEILARMRGRGNPFLQIILSTNPDAPTHWIYRRLILGQEATVFYSSAILNTYNDPRYLTTLQTLTGTSKLRLADGLWVQSSGTIWDNYDVHVHRIKPFPIPKTWPRFIAIDFGFTNPFVVLFGATDEDGRLYIFREIYMSRRTVNQHIPTILSVINDDGVQPEIIVCDHDAGDRETLALAGLYNEPANKEVEWGLSVVKDRFQVQADGKARLYIFDNSLVEVDERLLEAKRPTRLIEEIPGYVWAKNTDLQNPKEVPLKLNDHACFVAGTLITTEQGDVPIERVRIGDKVLTRQGYKVVTICGITDLHAKTNTVKFSDGTLLRCTPNHLIHTHNGFVRLDELSYSDIISTVSSNDFNLTGDIVCQDEQQNVWKRLCSRVLPIVDTLIQKTGLMQITLHQTACIENRVLIDFTERFGSPTMVKYLMAMRYIIRIVILATMLFQILKSCLKKITSRKQNFLENQNEQMQCESRRIKLDHLQSNGMVHKRVRIGIDNTVRLFGIKQKVEKRFAKTVEKVFLQEQRISEIGFAPTTVKHNIVKNLAWIMKHVSVSTVKKIFQSISTQKQKHVPLHVVNVIEDQKRSIVYNLTVADVPEYYANGILVHNCDALRYLCMYLDTNMNQGMEHA